MLAIEAPKTHCNGLLLRRSSKEDTSDSNVERLKSMKNAADEISIIDRELGQRK